MEHWASITIQKLAEERFRLTVTIPKALLAEIGESDFLIVWDELLSPQWGKPLNDKQQMKQFIISNMDGAMDAARHIRYELEMVELTMNNRMVYAEDIRIDVP